jgi:hypothetical protein
MSTEFAPAAVEDPADGRARFLAGLALPSPSSSSQGAADVAESALAGGMRVFFTFSITFLFVGGAFDSRAGLLL